MSNSLFDVAHDNFRAAAIARAGGQAPMLSIHMGLQQFAAGIRDILPSSKGDRQFSQAIDTFNAIQYAKNTTAEADVKAIAVGMQQLADGLRKVFV